MRLKLLSLAALVGLSMASPVDLDVRQRMSSIQPSTAILSCLLIRDSWGKQW